MSKILPGHLDSIGQLELGKTSHYDELYNPNRLYAISRYEKRLELGLDPENLPFVGYDIWNHYEVSWLNPKGKPIVAIAEISYDCHSPFIVESKSLKLYFNSFNFTKFSDVDAVEHTVKSDLETLLKTQVTVQIIPLSQTKPALLKQSFDGICLDELEVECTTYQVNPQILSTESEHVEEVLYSDLLKSNCLITHQPDWASVQIQYQGNKINHENLLRYIVSYRNHSEFHEQCIERIFKDILQRCHPEQLTIYGRYTRRGGLDINAYRSTQAAQQALNIRFIRQ
ncbi:MAG: NADPH-dependent 7-cyano-7-deazaguanine reductase QueF [Gammaproteobacteria bacterium]